MAISTAVQPGVAQLQQGAALPQTGLTGAYSALSGSALGNNYGGGNSISVGPTSQMAVNANPTQGYEQGGEQAQQMNAALTGALGADAQAQAYAQFQESPGQAYLREQAERSLLANSAATGGLTGGNVLKELQGQAVGLAAQDFQNQFDRRGTVADRGLSAANTYAEILMGQDRNQTSLDQSNISASASMANARTSASASLGAANINSQLQRDLAAAGYSAGAGNNIASNVAQSSSNLANFINQQGTNVGNIYANAGGQQGASFTNFADNAAGLRGNASGNFMGVSGVPQNNQNSFGNYGAMLSGVGGALEGYGQYQQTQNPGGVGGTGYNVNPNYGTAGASVAYPSYANAV